MAVQEVDIQTSERSLDREFTRTLNHMCHRISMAYAVELAFEKVDAGPVKKLLVQLNLDEQREHDDLVDVWRYNCKFDFAAFQRAPYSQQCETLLGKLQDGLLKVCQQLQLDPAPFEKVHAHMVRANFRYRYTRGKPIVNRKAGLSAQLAMILTPTDSAVVAEVASTGGGPPRTVTFIKQARPGVRFEVQYLGKIEWVGLSTLRLLPKDPLTAPIDAGVDA